MKRILCILCCITVFTSVNAQTVPQYIPYQAIARDASGQLLANSPISVEFKIFNTLAATSPVYTELHTLATNNSGYFNVNIGNGVPQSGTFGAINWQTGAVAYEIWLDTGSGLNLLGSRTGFLSVPYALYSGNASSSPTLNINSPNTVANPSTGVYNISVPAPTLSINSNQLSISNGNTVTLPSAGGSTYTAGTGIAISTGSVITNTAPDQTVTISGPSVLGSYPSFSITSAPVTTITSGSNVTVNQAGAAYTVSAVTPTLTGTGNALVSGTYPLQTINVPAASLTYTPATNTLKLTDGVSVNTVTLSTPASSTLTGTGLATVINSSPNYTVNVPTPVMGFNNATGTYSYTQGAYSNTINISPNLAISGTTLSAGSSTLNLPALGIWNRPGTGQVALVNVTDNVGVGASSPGYKLSVNENNTGNAALYSTNTYSIASSGAHGIVGLTSNNDPSASGIYGLNTSTGPSIYGVKTTGASGNAGRFETFNPSNTGDALFVNQYGTGPALHAVASSTAGGVLAGQFDGDTRVFGKVLTDSMQVTTPVTPVAGAVLTSRDAMGNTKWSNPIMFKANFSPSSITSVNTAVITGIGSTSAYSSSTAFNIGGGLSINASNMVFTAPVTGYYELNATMLVSVSPSSTGNAYVYLEIYNNTTGTTVGRAHSNNSDATSYFYTTLQVNTIVQLTQGQQVILRVGGSIASAGTITNNYSANLINQFSGSLIR